MTRATYLLLTDFERIEEWCQKVRRIFAGVGHVGVFLVGSALTRADYRDIDLRLMLTDETWDTGRWSDPVRTRYVNAMFSTWGQRETGLPIDFQVQRMGTANASFGDKPRDPMGVRDWERATPSGGTFDDPDTRVDKPAATPSPEPLDALRDAAQKTLDFLTMDAAEFAVAHGEDAVHSDTALIEDLRAALAALAASPDESPASLRQVRDAFEAVWIALDRIVQSKFTMPPQGDGFAEGYNAGLREAQGLAWAGIEEAFEAFGGRASDESPDALRLGGARVRVALALSGAESPALAATPDTAVPLDTARAALAHYLSTDTGEGLREALRAFMESPHNAGHDGHVDGFCRRCADIYEAGARALSTGARGLDEEMVPYCATCMANHHVHSAARRASPGEP